MSSVTEKQVQQGHTAQEITDAEIESQHSQAVESSKKYGEENWRAWLCAFATFLFLIPTYGFILGIGTIQAYLQNHQLKDFTARDIGWLPGVNTFLCLFFGLQVGPIVDLFSVRIMAPLSVVVVVPMFFLMAECTKYWHFMLCFGLLGGIGAAIASTFAVAIIGRVFLKYRGLAMGVAYAGSSTGGIMFPLMFRAAFARFGWAWSLRIVGFMALGLMVTAMCIFLAFEKIVEPEPEKAEDGAPEIPETIVSELTQVTSHRPRVQGSNTKPKKKSAQISFAPFRSGAFSLITASMLLLDFTIFGIAGILPSLVERNGFGLDTGFAMIATLNSFSLAGRLITGILGDRFGPFNVILGSALFTVISTAVTIIPFGLTHVQALWAFSALWGFGSGSFLPLLPVCMGSICESKDYGRYFGTMTFVNSFGLLVSVPISGQMLDSMGPIPLSGLYIACVFMGGATLFAARALVLGSWFKLAKI